MYFKSVKVSFVIVRNWNIESHRFVSRVGIQFSIGADRLDSRDLDLIKQTINPRSHTFGLDRIGVHYRYSVTLFVINQSRS